MPTEKLSFWLMNPKSPMLINCIFSLFILVGSATGQIYIPKSIIGKWEGIDSTNKMGSIEFLDSNHLRISIPDQGTLVCEYSLDTTKNPIWFDIIFQNGEKKATLRGLLKFLDDNTFKWQIFLDTERTKSFQKETLDNTIILTRRKEAS